MQLIVSNMAALAVAMAYYLWRDYYQVQLQRRSILCRRVAYLLWRVAEQIPNSDSALSGA